MKKCCLFMLFVFVLEMFVILTPTLRSFIKRQIGMIPSPETHFKRTQPLSNEMFELYDYRNIQIVLLGDSHTALADWSVMIPGYKTANLGVSGDDTEDVLERIYQVDKIRPQYCFIMLGINDIIAKRESSEIRENYLTILDSLQKYNATPVIVSTLLVIEDYLDATRINHEVAELNTFLQNQQHPFLDIGSQLQQNGALKPEYSTDGLHLSAKAYAIWRNAVLEFLLNRY